MSRIGGFTLLILGILAIIGIIMAGLKYITAGGDQQKAESGKKALLFSVYGIILAVLCVFLIQTTVNEIRRIAAPIPGATNTTEITMPFKNVGPVAELADFFNQNGLIWAVITLAIVYSEAVAIFFILYASFQYMTAYGDESKAEGAKKTIIWAVVGLAVVLSVNVILNIFTGFVL